MAKPTKKTKVVLTEVVPASTDALLTEVRSALRTWRISLKSVPSKTLSAADAEEAWDKFKAFYGILESVHAPLIEEVMSEQP